MNITRLVFPALATVFLFAMGTGVGRVVLRPWRRRFDSSLEFHAFAAGIGMGILAHTVLLLGLCGAWKAAGFIPAGLILAVVAAAGFRPFPVSRQVTPASRITPGPGAIIAVAALAFLIACMALRATTPPADYDVLEYHVGAVHHWLSRGGIVPFPHLFYSALPFEVEMWYAGGSFLEGNPLLAATPKLINFGVFLCAVGALYCLASALCRRREFRWLACLLFSIHPLAAIVAQDALNDMGLTWFATLAAVAWVRWFQARERPFFVLWAVFLGLTICCKYTSVGLIVFPAIFVMAPTVVLTKPRGEQESRGHGFGLRWEGMRSATRLLRRWFSMAAIIAAVFSPWALKNTLHYGNPTYPLLSGIFRSPTWSPRQTEFYVEAHGRTDPAAAAYWAALARNVARLGPWLVAAMAAACLLKRSRLVCVVLAATVGVGLLVHSVFPANPARFMLPLLPVMTALAGSFIEGMGRWERRLRAACLAPFLLWIVLALTAAFDPAMAAPAARSFQRIGLPVFAKGPSAPTLVRYLGSHTSKLYVLGQALGRSVVDSQRFINERTPRDSRVFLLFEARIGCFDRPVEVGSVFDRSPLLDLAAGTRSADELVKRLRDEGFDFLYVNEYELKRLSETYGGLRPSDRLNVAEAMDHYPPFSQDPRYGSCRSLIHNFVEECRRRAVYPPAPARPVGLWVARLGISISH